MAHLIDRRENGRNKSAVNRARFLRRYKDQIRGAVDRMIAERSIGDMEKGGKVSVPRKDISEPSFRHGRGGDREIVLPGNRDFVTGDRLPRPPQRGRAANEPGTGESEDDFVFALSREEFLQMFFEDLELPRLERTMLLGIEEQKPIRAGYTTTGSPNSLAVLRTMRTSLARRIALGSPIRRDLEAADRELSRASDAGREHEVQVLLERIDALHSRLRNVRFLDDFDLRYRNRVNVPEPVARAVMFCLMDVSASMSEAKKDLAKRFFTLLYLFLTRKYEHVELVFVRHTDGAEEVDEQTFFHDPRSGGTVVLSALQLMVESPSPEGEGISAPRRLKPTITAHVPEPEEVRPCGLLKASPKGEGFHPSQRETLRSSRSGSPTAAGTSTPLKPPMGTPSAQMRAEARASSPSTSCPWRATSPIWRPRMRATHA